MNVTLQANFKRAEIESSFHTDTVLNRNGIRLYIQYLWPKGQTPTTGETINKLHSLMTQLHLGAASSAILKWIPNSSALLPGLNKS